MSLVRANSLAKANGSQETSLDDLFGGRAKAWCNLNGTGTIAVRDSLNVSSLTDNGTGIYTQNWTTAFGSSSYVISCTSNRSAASTTNSIMPDETPNIAAGSGRITCAGSAGSYLDFSHVLVAAHGDL